ncbi:unnamed protein product [Onchocerca flexuosa]|uniref:Skp1 domain-containing protein n=1 Tax=Onchocerca flexuosa TaxID=387005 RepID=A0A183HSG1_9BILA|nr:unnamed protein product [Onchocerca flexuosa]
MIKGKSPEEIRRTFNIKNDFTPEEEEQSLLCPFLCDFLLHLFERKMHGAKIESAGSGGLKKFCALMKPWRSIIGCKNRFQSYSINT